MIKQSVNYLIKLKESGYTEEELLPLINDALSEYIKEDIEENIIDTLCSPFVEVLSTKELNINDNREEILKNTINKYIDANNENYLILKNNLSELSFYDKIIERDNINYFFLIDLLLTNYALHLKALEALSVLKKQNDVDVSGVALSTSTTPKAIISKQYNSVETLLKSMPENKELIFRQNAYNEYLRNPLSANTVLHTVNLLGGIKSLSEEENNYAFNSRKVINSATPIEKNDIYKSANLLIAIFFKQGSIWIKSLKTKKIISVNKMIDINEVLMQNIFEVKNILNKNNLKKVIQVKTNFDDTPLYEFQNKKNKKIHPAFEDNHENQKFWNEFTEYFKGKIPLKEPR